MRAWKRGALAAAAPIALGLAGCGTQNLAFPGADAEPPDAPVEAAPEAAPDGAQPPGCTTDFDCEPLGLHCDPSSSQCVACVVSAQCKSATYGVCDSTSRQCVQCQADGDCGAGTCEPTTHRCIPSCDDAGACQNGLFCDPRTAECIGCTTDEFCAAEHGEPLLCNTAIGQCVECVDDGDCAGTDQRKCDATTGRCVECLDAQDCKAGEACYPLDHFCVDLGGSGPGPGVDAGPGPAPDGGGHMPL